MVMGWDVSGDQYMSLYNYVELDAPSPPSAAHALLVKATVNHACSTSCVGIPRLANIIGITAIHRNTLSYCNKGDPLVVYII